MAERDLERSEAFEDVTNEAIEIHDRFHTGLIVNNNERNEDFDVIDQNLRHDEVSNFEDKSYERSSCLTESVNDSITDSMLESYRSNIADDSIESEKPLEISISAAAESTPVQKASGDKHPLTGKDVQGVKDLIDYDIVESATGSPAVNRKKAENGSDDISHGKLKEVTALASLEPAESQSSSEELNTSPCSKAFLVADDFVAKNIVAEEEVAGSDIVDIELRAGSAADTRFDDKPGGVTCDEDIVTSNKNIGLNPHDEILTVERVGSDIVDIEIPDASPVSAKSETMSEDTSISPELIKEVREEHAEKEPANVPINEAMTACTSASLTETHEESNTDEFTSEPVASPTIDIDLKSDIVNIDLPLDTAKDAHNHGITPPQLTTDLLKEKSRSPDDEGFDNIEPEEIFEDAKSEFSEEFSSLGSKEGDKQDICAEDLEHFEEVDIPSGERNVEITDGSLTNVATTTDDAKLQRIKLGSGEQFFSLEEATGEIKEEEEFEQVDSPLEERGQKELSTVILSAPTEDPQVEASKDIKSESRDKISSLEAGKDEVREADAFEQVNSSPEEKVTNNIDSLQTNSLGAGPEVLANVPVDSDLTPVDSNGDVPVLQDIDTQGNLSSDGNPKLLQGGVIDIESLTESGKFGNGIEDSVKRGTSKEIDILKMIDDTPETVGNNEVSSSNDLCIDGGFVSPDSNLTNELPAVGLQERNQPISVMGRDETNVKGQRKSGEGFEEVDVNDIKLQENMETTKDSALTGDENEKFFEVVAGGKGTENQGNTFINVELGEAVVEVTESIVSSSDKPGDIETEGIKKADDVAEFFSEHRQAEVQLDEAMVSEESPSESSSTRPEPVISAEDVKSDSEESAAAMKNLENETDDPLQRESEVSAIETKDEDIIEIPDKDYSSDDVNSEAENIETRELSVQRPADLNIEETKATAEIQGSASLMQHDNGQSERGSTPDKLIVEFETRTRLGSMSPERMRTGSFRRITPQASPESVRREPPKELSPQPVPKERKKNKKKKKKKKGTIKMLVQEIVTPSQDSDGTGDDTMEEPAIDDVTHEDLKEQNGARDSPEISSNSEAEGRSSEKKDDGDTKGPESQVVVISEKKGNSEREGDSGKEEDKKQGVDEKNETMRSPNQGSIAGDADVDIAIISEIQEEKDDVPPMEVRRLSVSSTSETSDVEAGGKAKGKDKKKSKKESKKDGCKSQ